MQVRALIVFFGLALVATGCGSEVSGDYASVINTEVDPASIAAGGTADVTCIVTNRAGIVAPVDTVFTTSSPGTLAQTATTVSGTIAGDYTVHCEVPGVELKDQEGAPLTITAGAPVRITTTLGAESIQVNTTTTVDCLVEDEFGNAVTIETTVETDEGATAADGEVGSELIGTYGVACTLAEMDGVASVPATLEVTHGDPVTIVLNVKPDLPRYAVEAAATFSWVVTDEYGNEIEGLPATFTPPADGYVWVNEEDHRVRFVADGLYTYSVALDAPWDALTDSREIRVDSTGPIINIPWPQRGEQVLAEGPNLSISGTVVDAFSDVKALRINGDEVPVASDGTFTYVMDPNWGVNVLIVSANDQWGNLTKLSPSFHYAKDYTSFDDTDAQGVTVADGLELLLGQEFLDDGDHDPSNINDLATLLEVVVGGLDLESLLDGLGDFSFDIPVLDIDVLDIAGIIEVSVSGIATIDVGLVEPTGIGPVVVSLDSREGGIDTGIELGDATTEGIELSLSVTATLPIVLSWDIVFIGPGSISVGAEADLSSAMSVDSVLLLTAIDIAKDSGGPLSVDLQDIEIGLNGLEIDPIQDIVVTLFAKGLPLVGDVDIDLKLSDLLDLTVITDAILDPITAGLVPLILDFIEPLLETFADDTLAGLLSALEFGTSLPLPDLLGTGAAVDLEIYTGLDRVDFSDDGGQIGLLFGTWAEKGTAREPEGSIVRGGCLTGPAPTTFDYAWDRSAGLAVKVDVANAGLFAIWWSGFIDGLLDLGGLLGGGGGGALPIPIDDLALEMEWYLPPIISDCNKADLITLEIGDLHVFLTGDMLGLPIEAELFIDTVIAVAFTSGVDGLSVTIGDFQTFEVEVVAMSEIDLGFIDLRSLLEDQLGPILSGFVAGQSFGPLALPPIALDSLVPGLPPEAVLELGNLSIDPQEGYLVIGGDLQ